MIEFGQGHRGPTVVLLQIVLNSHPPQSRLEVNGIFDRLTTAALRQFQAHHRLSETNGRVGAATWQALMRITGLKTIDVADVDDLIVALQERPGRTLADVVRSGHQYGIIAAHELARAGQRDLIAMIGLSDGVPIMVDRVESAAASSRIALLRIYGHGVRGVQIVSAGRGVIGGSATHHSALTARSVTEMSSYLERLRPLFASFGSAELHGCSVGRGLAGRNLLRELAAVWGVPVTAGIGLQRVGRGATFRFEGPVLTAYPNGADLEAWAAAVESTQAFSAPP